VEKVAAAIVDRPNPIFGVASRVPGGMSEIDRCKWLALRVAHVVHRTAGVGQRYAVKSVRACANRATGSSNRARGDVHRAGSQTSSTWD